MCIRDRYEGAVNPGVINRGLNYLQFTLGNVEVNKVIKYFLEQFPPQEVYLGKISIDEYLSQRSEGRSNLEVTLEEIILLHFANFNPAGSKLRELFDDSQLSQQTLYSNFIIELENFFRTQKKFGPDNQFLFDLLRTPILANPHSLEEQLKFIKSKWGLILSPRFLERILSSFDLIKEDSKLFFKSWAGTVSPEVPVYKPIGDAESKYKTAYQELLDYEKFTPDLDWMPNVVLLAKNIFVWLNQLSKKYGRDIYRLDHIPGEEFEQISNWGFTGLWLIGVWDRSSASQKIKRIMGNPEAAPSAYSLYDYVIANQLGGEEAFQNLNWRAKQKGIRLACDMVPNHMGIYSKWVVEKPDYFIQTNICPFPNYSFTGIDLSEDS
ncbi:MAG: alpha-amylase family glycosyl hydrolase, partial [Ignavibacteria bacterium]|nr:alpha-amylase family glycosyl hydrolase [Ignavibacteria bacterium]